jgi:hypothetical protein
LLPGPTALTLLVVSTAFRRTELTICGMCARSWDTMVCINIQGMLAIVPWVPVMPERWRGDEPAK